MAEPAAIFKTAIDIALPVIKQFLAEAADKNKKQTERAVSYLRAAQYSVDVLHKEFEAIIAQAEVCDVGQTDQIGLLKGRIHYYLNTNIIRGELWKILPGMDECRTVLQERVDSIWNLLGNRQEQQNTMADFIRTIEDLQGYIANLGYEYPSGVGLEMLGELEHCLDELYVMRRAIRDSDAIVKILNKQECVAQLQERRKINEQIERTINRLLASF